MAYPSHYDSTRPVSLWQRVDPRVRLIVVAVFSTLALASTEWRHFLCVYVVICSVYLLSRTGPAAAWKGFRPFFLLIALTALLQLILSGGTPLVEGMPVFSSITREGVRSALLVISRLAAVIILSTHLVLTTSPHELSRSLGWAFSPLTRFGAPVADLMLILNMAFQFFPLLSEETRNVRMGLESRGISPRHPRIGHRLKATAAWVLAVLTAVLERSHRTAAALQIKEGGRDRSLRLRFDPWNVVSSLVLAAVPLWAVVWHLL